MSLPKNTIYGGDAITTTVYRDSIVLSPIPSQKMRNHSPTGFNWGYGGSGPAQLALAILLDYYGPDAPELDLYQDFKFAVIAALSQDQDWTLTGFQIEHAMSKLIVGAHFDRAIDNLIGGAR